MKNKNSQLAVQLQHATGKIDYTFTNDYMFRAILRKNLLVTKALVAALLHLKMEDISP